MFNSFLSTKGFCYGEISHQVWKKSIRTWLAPVPQAPILLRPGAKRHPTEKGRIYRGNDRKPAIFQGKKSEDLIHKDGRLEILQKWKFVSPKIGICHWLICVRRLLNIKLCEMDWNGASPIAWGYHAVWDPLL